MIGSWLHRYPRLFDVSLVVLLLVLGLGAVLRNAHGAAAAALVVCETLPLLVRRRWPVAVAAVAAAASIAMIALGVWVVPLQLGVALYTLPAIREGRSRRAVAAAAIVAVAIAELASARLEVGVGAARVVFLIAAALLGDSIGSRRAYVREIEEKA